jgi:hypothetical protein
MKGKIALVAASFALVMGASSFTFGPVDDVIFNDDQPQKKEKTVKVIVHSDGKTAKIDTTFIDVDDKLVHTKVDSMLKEMKVTVFDNGDGDVLIWNEKGDPNGKFEHFNFFADSLAFKAFDSDTTGMMMKHRVLRHGDGPRRMVFIQDNNGNHMIVPPVPPVPPIAGTPHTIMLHRQGDPFAFDPKDKNIISYKRKDMGKDLEKITIVRKKVKNIEDNREVEVVVTE